MCGIAGFVGREGGEATRATLRRMCDAIRHRGPDDEGFLVEPDVALGMRRLSIIDVAGGKQPIGSEDGAVQVVFNGEIYNHRGLQRDLEGAGHRFATRSDTEVLVHLYEDHGDALVHRLRGMYGFALWDARRRRLLVARDRLGIKPLYYWPTANGVAFASELRSLLALPDFPRAIDDTAVAEYLALGYVPEPRCIFRGVHKLPPGHTLTWSREAGVQVAAYWRPTDVRPVAIGEREAIEELRRLIGDAVESHLESDVPLGAFLSGGIDSSTVVAEMARRSTRAVRTFSIGFEDPRYDESADARAVAAAIGTDHTELIVRPDADALVEEVVRTYDEPFADSSALPTYLVSALARQHVKVALSGDGGDELFAGYTRYAEAAKHAELPAAFRWMLRSSARLLPHVAPGRNRLLDLGRSREGRYTATVARALSPAEGGVASERVVAAGVPLGALLADRFRDASHFDGVTRLTAVDMVTYLPGDILTKVDRASMAVSLEARVPLLDHHLVEFALSLPGALKLRDGTGKWVLREAIRGLVPPRVLEKRKQGFAVPLRSWFRHELRHRVDALQAGAARIGEYVDERAVARIVREHLARRRDHSDLVWRLMALELWLASLERGDIGRPASASAALADVLETAPRAAVGV